MTTQSESKRPVLTLMVTEEPHLTPRKNTGQVHIAAEEGEVVDPFWKSVIDLVEHLKSEYKEITSKNPLEGPTVKVALPQGCTFNQIEEAFRMIREQGWDILPAMLYSSDVIYLRNYQC
jgi:predicted transcriptional regulator